MKRRLCRFPGCLSLKREGYATCEGHKDLEEAVVLHWYGLPMRDVEMQMAWKRETEKLRYE